MNLQETEIKMMNVGVWGSLCIAVETCWIKYLWGIVVFGL